MKARAALAAIAALLITGTMGASSLPDAAEPSVEVIGPASDTLPGITPTFLVRASGFDSLETPVSLRLLIASDPQFTSVIADTTVVGDSASITLTRPLPDGGTVFWRATARGAAFTTATSAITGPHVVPRWLRLVSPNVPAGITLSTPRPTFTWSSAEVASPPGPWMYTFELLRTSDLQPQLVANGLTGTSFTPALDLAFNSSFRWRVTASLSSGDTARAISAASFVIVDPGTPVATLLYQNFPNPFPSNSTNSTCIWFDLRQAASVRLEIYDIRAHLVRRLIPGPGLPSEMLSGRYGRGVGTPGGGCDPRFTWDGTGDDGRFVSAGVYLIRLTADRQSLLRRAVFRGR
jgi:hypothetical protein